MTFHACDGVTVPDFLTCEPEAARASPHNYRDYFEAGTPHGYHRLGDTLRIDDIMEAPADAGWTYNPDDDEDDRLFEGWGARPVYVIPAVSVSATPAQPEPAPAAPALVPDLGLPDAPCTAVNEADEMAEAGIRLDTGRDRVLSFHYTVDPAFIAATGIEPTGNKEQDRAVNALLTDLARAADVDPEGWVSYSRTEDFYTSHGRYKGQAYTFTYVKRAVDLIKEAGLAVEKRAKPGSHRIRWRPAPGENLVQGRQSRLRATPKLLAIFRNVTAFSHVTAALIRLRDKDNKLVAYRDTKQTRDMAKGVKAYTEFMAGHRIELVTAPGVCEPTRTGLKLRHVDEDGTVTFQHICPTPTLTFFRSFNRGSFRKGGRWYCWPQALSKELRGRMLINGEPVVELDYSAHHARILYALRGIPLAADADPYEIPAIPDVERDHAKVAFNVLVNASSTTGAHKALLKKKDAAKKKDRWLHGPEVTQAICEAVVARNAPVADDFGSDKGVDLMFIDSTMMTWILKQCQEAGLPAIPVHDSVVGPASREAELKAIMEAAWARRFNASNPCVVRRPASGLRQSPPVGSFAAPDPGSVLPVAPAGVQVDLVGSLQVNLPCVRVGARAYEALGVGVETLDRRGGACAMVSRHEVVPGLYRASGSVQTRSAELAAIRLDPGLRAAIAQSISQNLPPTPGLPRMDPGLRAILLAKGGPVEPRQAPVRPGLRSVASKPIQAPVRGYRAMVDGWILPAGSDQAMELALPAGADDDDDLPEVLPAIPDLPVGPFDHEAMEALQEARRAKAPRGRRASRGRIATPKWRRGW
jgi:hypothetical protein